MFFEVVRKPGHCHVLPGHLLYMTWCVVHVPGLSDGPTRFGKLVAEAGRERFGDVLDREGEGRCREQSGGVASQ